MSFHLSNDMDVPCSVIGWVLAGASSVGILAQGAWRFVVGQVPDPNLAGSWSFYGILIVAIIVLFTSLATVIAWVATKGLNILREVVSALKDLREGIGKVGESVDRTNEFMDSVGRDLIRHNLNKP